MKNCYIQEQYSLGDLWTGGITGPGFFKNSAVTASEQ